MQHDSKSCYQLPLKMMSLEAVRTPLPPPPPLHPPYLTTSYTGDYWLDCYWPRSNMVVARELIWHNKTFHREDLYFYSSLFYPPSIRCTHQPKGKCFMSSSPKKCWLTGSISRNIRKWKWQIFRLSRKLKEIQKVGEWLKIWSLPPKSGVLASLEKRNFGNIYSFNGRNWDLPLL